MNRREFLKMVSAAGLVPLAVAGAAPASTKIVPASVHAEGFFPTGFPTLDFFLGGGIRRGSLGIILGKPGSGKTFVAKSILKHNFPQINETYGINGHTDVLHMWSSEVLPDMAGGCLVCDVPVSYDYKAMESMRSYLVAADVAGLITMQPNNSDEDMPKSFDVLRLADFVLSIRRSTVYIVKNRWGRNGSSFPLTVCDGKLVEGF